MKQFMKTCYKCKAKVKPVNMIEDGKSLYGLRCSKCGETYFSSSDIIKHEIKTGKRKLVRKFGIIGDSTVMRFPKKVLKEYNIKPGDYGLFEKRPEGILIKLIHATELEN
jgi:hypothetical protein